MTRRAVACGLFFALAVASPARAGWLRPHTFAVSPEPHEQGGAVAATTNGRAIVASHRFDGFSDVVEVSERGGPTADWQPPRRLTPFAANAHYPQVALDEAGDAIVLWTLTYSEYDEVVQASVRIGPGGSWSPPEQISPAGEWSELGKIAFDDQGNATAVWANITHSVVQASTWNASTRRWSAPETISSGPIRSGPLLAVSPSGRAVAAWSSPTRNDVIVRAAIRPSRTAPWLAEQDLSQPDGYASVNDIAEHPSGRTIVMWDRFRATTDYVEVATLPAGSLEWGPPEILNRAGTSGYNGDVEIGQDGTAFASWERNIELEHVGVDISIRGPNDTRWSAPEPIAENAFIPKLAVDAAGNAVVAFAEVAWFTTIEARVRDAVTGTWGPVAKLSQSVFEAYPADIGVDSIGGVFALWQLHSDQCYCFMLQGADYVGGSARSSATRPKRDRPRLGRIDSVLIPHRRSAGLP